MDGIECLFDQGFHLQVVAHVTWVHKSMGGFEAYMISKGKVVTG